VAAWLEAGEDSWLKALENKKRILRYSFASEVLPVPDRGWRRAFASQTGPAAGVTDLGAALIRAAQDAASQSAEAVVLVTDGGHNAPGDPRETAAALRGVPLYVVPIGDVEMPRDVILHHTHCPRAVFKNDTVVLDSMVTAYGCEGEQLRVELLSDSNVVAQKTLAASSKVFDGRINFQWKAADLGRHRLQVRVAPLSGEYSIENNEAQTEVEVMEDTIRVLIADDRPRWEFRYLVSLFKRDKHVEFDQLLFEPNDEPNPLSPSGGERAEVRGSKPSLPQNLEAWTPYRVIILGDITPGQLPPPQQELLRKYVAEQGGNLVLISGETAMPLAFADQPLAAMIPISLSPSDGERGPSTTQGRTLAVTAEGSVSVATQLDDDPLASDRLWREMSLQLPIYLSAGARPKPTSHVLIAATGSQPGAEPEAFLSWQYVGLGRVIYIAAPVTYQLRYRNGDRYHHRFWGQLLRWAVAREMASGSKTVRLSTDKTSYEKGEQAQIVVHLSRPEGKVVAGAQCSVEARREGQVVKLLELRKDHA